MSEAAKLNGRIGANGTIMLHDSPGRLPRCKTGRMAVGSRCGRAIAIRDITEITQRFSSCTVLFTAAWIEDGLAHERSLVARLQRDVAEPMLAEVFHQYRVMQAIASHSSAEVPAVEFEDDPAVLGKPFFRIDRIDGRVPPDFPSYHAQSWFAGELDAAALERHWWNGNARCTSVTR